MPIFGVVGGAQVWAAASGGKVYAYNAMTTLVQVVPANPSRRRLTFHNPGPIDIMVGPVVNFNGVTLVPTTAAYGGCFRVFANGGTLVIEGECTGAWQALTSDASAGILTVMDSNIS